MGEVRCSAQPGQWPQGQLARDQALWEGAGDYCSSAGLARTENPEAQGCPGAEQEGSEGQAQSCCLRPGPRVSRPPWQTVHGSGLGTHPGALPASPQNCLRSWGRVRGLSH